MQCLLVSSILWNLVHLSVSVCEWGRKASIGYRPQHQLQLVISMIIITVIFYVLESIIVILWTFLNFMLPLFYSSMAICCAKMFSTPCFKRECSLYEIGQVICIGWKIEWLMYIFIYFSIVINSKYFNSQIEVKSC